MNYYIHQIGNINDEKTYERLVKILKLKTIASRGYLEKNGIKIDYDYASFEMNIPEEKKWMYYEEDIHKDRVSLSDPEDKFIKISIEKKTHKYITCFDYDYITFAVSRQVPIVPKEQTKGLALGEVQVQDKIDAEYIIGLILPFSKEQLKDDSVVQIIDKISEICSQNDFPLDIFNYDGDLLKEKVHKKAK